jgi:hypothetical protein
LLVINTLADLQMLYKLAPDPAPTVDAFFADDLNACGTVEPTLNGALAGCAQLPGHIFVEDSAAAELSPATLMGHELGHNLNLEHDFFSSLNLMSSFFPHGRDLTDVQVAIILQSPLVQTDSTGQRFIQITPIAILAPEPSTLLLLGAAPGRCSWALLPERCSRSAAHHQEADYQKQSSDRSSSGSFSACSVSGQNLIVPKTDYSPEVLMSSRKGN